MLIERVAEELLDGLLDTDTDMLIERLVADVLDESGDALTVEEGDRVVPSLQHKIVVVESREALYIHPYPSPFILQDGPFTISHPVRRFAQRGSIFACITEHDTTVSLVLLHTVLAV